MELSKRNLIIIAVALLVVVGVVAVLTSRPNTPTTPGSGGNGTGTGTSSPNPTRTALPANVTVPAQGQAPSPDVAPAQTVAPANANTTSQYRSYNISAKNNQFTPNTIIVHQEDIVNIYITAVDKKYDFTQPDYGFKETIAQGQTKQIQFGATAVGKFMYYCASCGGPSSGPIGYIEVVPKQ